MAVRRYIEVEREAPREKSARPRPQAAGSHSAAASSPALELQAQLAAEFSNEKRWPPAATLAFVLATCGGFWSLVAWGVSSLAG